MGETCPCGVECKCSDVISPIEGRVPPNAGSVTHQNGDSRLIEHDYAVFTCAASVSDGTLGDSPSRANEDYLSRRCEELQGDVVRVSERKTRPVRRVDDTAVNDPEGDQPRRPLLKLSPVRATEGDVVKAWS